MAEEIPRVSSDGEPHEVLTIVAVSSGALLAVLILIILRINLKKPSSRPNEREKQRFSLFGVRRSLDISTNPQPESEIFTIEGKIIPPDTRISIDEYPESDKFLYIPGITTISM